MANTFGGITKQADAFAITASAYTNAAEEAERASHEANSMNDKDDPVHQMYAHKVARDAHDDAAMIAPTKELNRYHINEANQHHQKYLDLDSENDYRNNG